jgi:FixJ family two-component response regulator
MSVIAVIDDDPSVRRALERLLRSAGYGVSAHGSGAEFLRSLEVSLPACVVLDVHMPELTGLDLLPALRERLNGRAVLVVTADQNPRTRRRAMALGAVACLSKPLDDAALLEAIAAALQQCSAG